MRSLMPSSSSSFYSIPSCSLSSPQLPTQDSHLQAMPKHQVPAFGDWGETNNQTYTIIFNHARAEKGSIKINPNDPEFFSSLQEQQPRPVPGDAVGDGQPGSVTTQEAEALPSYRPKPTSRRVRRSTDHGNRESIGSPLNAGLSAVGNDVGILPQNNGNADEETDSLDSSSSAESAPSHGLKSSGGRRDLRSAQSRLHPTAYQGRLGNKVGMHHPSRSTPTWGNTKSDEPQAVLPPFGAWDDKNSVSGEDYTAIFTVLRDEKKGTKSAGTSPLNPETPGRKKQEASATRRKKAWGWQWCCYASEVDERALQSGYRRAS